jgi:hypothetical protein
MLAHEIMYGLKPGTKVVVKHHNIHTESFPRPGDVGTVVYAMDHAHRRSGLGPYLCLETKPYRCKSVFMIGAYTFGNVISFALLLEQFDTIPVPPVNFGEYAVVPESEEYFDEYEDDEDFEESIGAEYNYTVTAIGFPPLDYYEESTGPMTAPSMHVAVARIVDLLGLDTDAVVINLAVKRVSVHVEETELC